MTTFGLDYHKSVINMGEPQEVSHLKFVNANLRDEIRQKDAEIAKLRQQLERRRTSWELLLG